MSSELIENEKEINNIFDNIKELVVEIKCIVL